MELNVTRQTAHLQLTVVIRLHWIRSCEVHEKTAAQLLSLRSSTQRGRGVNAELGSIE